MMFKDNGVPLYYQLETIIRRSILSGEFPEGGAIPTEGSLAETYGVSRVTVRQALAVLEKDGLLLRKRGKGTFIRKNRVKALQPTKLVGSLDDLISLGIRTDAKMLGSSWVATPMHVKEALQLRSASQVFRVERIRYVEEGPLSYVVNYFPPQIGKKLERVDLDQKPILIVLEEDLNVRVAEAEQTMDAVIADATLASLLDVRVGSPLLKVSRTVYDEAKQPVEYVSVSYRADRYSLSVHLRRNRAEGAPSWDSALVNDRERQPESSKEVRKK